jgi:hydroxymethylpyrimidine/phosphomethylpyrimidine kinase
MSSSIPIALTIAGSDPSGGAGIQADLKAFSALHVYGASVITAITSQNTLGVYGIHDVPPSMIAQQMTSVLSDLDVRAVKIGMLSRHETIKAVTKGLEAYRAGPIVLDPVMVATSGDLLLKDDAITLLTSQLIPKAFLITPNLHEAAMLLGEPHAESEEDMRQQAQALLNFGSQAVLLKGGHGSGEESVDILATKHDIIRLAVPRINTRNTHGTGCTLSSAITAELAKGHDLVKACGRAKHYLTGALNKADELKIGFGSGPVHHFHAFY